MIIMSVTCMIIVGENDHCEQISHEGVVTDVVNKSHKNRFLHYLFSFYILMKCLLFILMSISSNI